MKNNLIKDVQFNSIHTYDLFLHRENDFQMKTNAYYFLTRILNSLKFRSTDENCRIFINYTIMAKKKN